MKSKTPGQTPSEKTLPKDSSADDADERHRWKTQKSSCRQPSHRGRDFMPSQKRKALKARDFSDAL
jgi:hypothetical protein